MTSPDIYNLTTPFGLLDQRTRNAIKEYYHQEGGVQFYNGNGWHSVLEPMWNQAYVYRAVRKPVVQANTKSMWLTDYGAVITGPTCLCYKVTAHYNTIDGVIDPSSYRVEAQ